MQYQCIFHNTFYTDTDSESESDVELQASLHESGNQRLTEKDNFHHLYEQLSKHSDKWSSIGSHLGFLQSELDIIKAKPLLLSEAPNSWLREMLAEWLQWAPGDSQGSRVCATLNALKKALCKAGLRETALSLRT